MKIIAITYLAISILLLLYSFPKLNFIEKANTIILCLMPLMFLNNPKIVLFLHLLYTYLVLTAPLNSINKLHLLISLLGCGLWFYSNYGYGTCYFTERQFKTKKKIYFYSENKSVLKGFVIFFYCIILTIYKLLNFKVSSRLTIPHKLIHILVGVIIIHELLITMNAIESKSLILHDNIIKKIKKNKK